MTGCRVEYESFVYSMLNVFQYTIYKQNDNMQNVCRFESLAASSGFRLTNQRSSQIAHIFELRQS